MSATLTIEQPQKCEEYLVQHAFLSGQSLPGAEDARLMAQVKEPPCRKATPFLFAWWWTLCAIPTETRESWGKQAVQEPKKKAAKEEQAKKEAVPEKEELPEDDLFGEETEEDKKAAEERKAKKAAEAEKKSKAKAEIIMKSRVVFEVKGFELEQDFQALGDKIINEIEQDGLVWQKKFEIVPEAFGMKKLKMTMTIEDEKISSDDILDRIAQWEDEVQSCDVIEFTKA